MKKTAIAVLLSAVGCASAPEVPVSGKGNRRAVEFVTMELPPRSGGYNAAASHLVARVVDTSVVVSARPGLPSREDFAKVADILYTLRNAHPHHEFALAACSPDGRRGYLSLPVRWADEDVATGSAPNLLKARMADGEECEILFTAHSHPKYSTGAVSNADVACLFGSPPFSLILKSENETFGVDCSLPKASTLGAMIYVGLPGDASRPMWIPMQEERCKADKSAPADTAPCF